MESVLGQLVTVPGVVGGMVYDAEGTVLSRTFPPIFDDAALPARCGCWWTARPASRW